MTGLFYARMLFWRNWHCALQTCIADAMLRSGILIALCLIYTGCLAQDSETTEQPRDSNEDGETTDQPRDSNEDGETTDPTTGATEEYYDEDDYENYQDYDTDTTEQTWTGSRVGQEACGVRTTNPKQNRIVGGKDAQLGSWPWQVSLVYNDDKTHGCGGTLITEDIVVTAAHCIDDNKFLDFTVVLGSHTLSQVEPGEVTVRPLAVVNHPDWFDHQIDDIALIKLEEKVKFNNVIQPACLPKGRLNAGSYCFATGWGDLKFEGKPPDVLQQVRLQVITDERCRKFGGDYSNVDKVEMCTYTKGKDACQGDSGGPFVCNVNGKWTLHGVVSWGEKCAQKSPGVFIEVSYFTDWIEKYLQ